MWELRETIPEGEKRWGGSVKHDISVPLSSLERFLDRVYWDKGDLKSLFLSPEIFVNARLSSLVGGGADAAGGFDELLLLDRQESRADQPR